MLHKWPKKRVFLQDTVNTMNILLDVSSNIKSAIILRYHNSLLKCNISIDKVRKEKRDRFKIVFYQKINILYPILLKLEGDVMFHRDSGELGEKCEFILSNGQS